MPLHIVLLTLSLVLFFAPRALGHDVQLSQGPSAQIVQTAPTESRTIDYVEPAEAGVFSQSLRGLLAGSLVGAGAGYLSVVGSDSDEPWRDILLGSGIGALSGAGIGLSLGLLDAADGFRSPTRYIMRDALYGTALGGVFGSIAGGLVALDSDDAEDILVGASIGAIAGVVLGSVVGVVEGHWRPRREPTHKVSTTIVVSQDSTGQRLLMPTVQGHF